MKLCVCVFFWNGFISHVVFLANELRETNAYLIVPKYAQQIVSFRFFFLFSPLCYSRFYL